MIGCKKCGNPIIENHTLALCPSCNRKRRKREDNARYKRERKQYMEWHPRCEVENCSHKSADIHHKKGRVGALLYDRRYFMAVCRKHHTQIETHPEWAKRMGYSLSRLQK